MDDLGPTGTVGWFPCAMVSIATMMMRANGASNVCQATSRPGQGVVCNGTKAVLLLEWSLAPYEISQDPPCDVSIAVVGEIDVSSNVAKRADVLDLLRQRHISPTQGLLRRVEQPPRVILVRSGRSGQPSAAAAGIAPTQRGK